MTVPATPAPLLRRLGFPRLGFRRGAPAFAVEFLPDGEAIERAPMPWLARSTLYTLTALLAAAVLWAALARVDRTVSAGGRLVTTAPLVVAQPLETAVVRAVAVEAGDAVKAGDLLATLDPTFAAADLADLSARLAAVQAQIGRLEAELEGAPFDPAAAGADGPVQAAILERRRAEYRARLDAMDERAAQLRAEIATSQGARKGLAERVALMAEVEDIRRQLVEKQTGSRLSWLDARAERMRLRDELESMANRERESGHELARVAAERAAFIDEWRRKAAEELVGQRRERATLVEQIAKAERRRSLVTLTAPVDAVVLEVARRSVGSVVREAEPLVTLVPAGVPLEVEAEIPSADIGLVRPGDTVRVKLDAFPFQRHGTLTGEVRTISADAFQRGAGNGGAGGGGEAANGAPAPREGAAVFRARIRLTETALEGVPEGTRLSPGMVATAEIRIGTRSVLSYFLYPVIRAFDESIREP